jgi:hypothetical protein
LNVHLYVNALEIEGKLAHILLPNTFLSTDSRAPFCTWHETKVYLLPYITSLLQPQDKYAFFVRLKCHYGSRNMVT